MKNKIFLLCIICFFTACSKNQKLTAKENTIVTKNEIISNEDFGELEKLKPLLEIKIGTERNQVKEILNGYSLNEEDEDSISYKLFKIYDHLETGEDDIELELIRMESQQYKKYKVILLLKLLQEGLKWLL